MNKRALMPRKQLPFGGTKGPIKNGARLKRTPFLYPRLTYFQEETPSNSGLTREKLAARTASPTGTSSLEAL